MCSTHTLRGRERERRRQPLCWLMRAKCAKIENKQRNYWKCQFWNETRELIMSLALEYKFTFHLIFRTIEKTETIRQMALPKFWGDNSKKKRELLFAFLYLSLSMMSMLNVGIYTVLPFVAINIIIGITYLFFYCDVTSHHTYTSKWLDE